MAAGGGNPVYMAKLRESRIRQLPPMSPIREVSGTQTPQTQRKLQLPEEYSYLMAPGPAKHDPRWSEEDVNDVVKQYLRAATHGGGNPMEPQPNALCACCNDINAENKRRKHELHTHPQYTSEAPVRLNPGHPPMPNNALRKPIKYEETRAQQYGADVGHYRTESPQLLSDSKHVPDYENAVLDQRKIFVTQPAKNSLYSNWGVRNDLEQYGKDRVIAEGVVQASSNFIDAMEKLKKISTPR